MDPKLKKPCIRDCEAFGTPDCLECQNQGDAMCGHPREYVKVREDPNLGEIMHCNICGEEWI